MRTVLSHEELAMRRLSGKKATHLTVSVWPTNVRSGRTWSGLRRRAAEDSIWLESQRTFQVGSTTRAAARVRNGA